MYCNAIESADLCPVATVEEWQATALPRCRFPVLAQFLTSVVCICGLQFRTGCQHPSFHTMQHFRRSCLCGTEELDRLRTLASQQAHSSLFRKPVRNIQYRPVSATAIAQSCGREHRMQSGHERMQYALYLSRLSLPSMRLHTNLTKLCPQALLNHECRGT